MKRICLLFTLLLIAGTLSARSADSTRKHYYEGSVSVMYMYPTILGLETIHGVRMCNEHLFLGGYLNSGVALFFGAVRTHIGVLSRYMFLGRKLDAFLGLGVAYQNTGTSKAPDFVKEFHHRAVILLEVGTGIKLRNEDFIDISVKCNIEPCGHSTWKELFIPSLAIGYRF